MTAAAIGKAGHHMERGIDGMAIERIEIGLRMVGRRVVNESKRARSGAHRDGRGSAIGAGGDIAKRPGGVEQAALARVAIGEADAAVFGIVEDALAVRIMRAAMALGPTR